MRQEFTATQTPAHTPVMVEECMDMLSLTNGGVFVDATLGAGGHTRAMLERVSNATIIGIDADEQAIEHAKETMPETENTVRFFHAYFADIATVLIEAGIDGVDGILADLGVSSFALDTPERGFSFKEDGPLDMRFNSESDALTAADIIHSYSEKELAELFSALGDEPFAYPIARNIAARRSKEYPQTTTELAKIVRDSVPPKVKYGRIHPATRVFQALRMKVNGELEQLERFLFDAMGRLHPGGRLAVISFHSGEDRIVKHTFRNMADREEGEIVTPKPIIPTDTEQRANVRSRSAKLRVIQKYNS